MAELIENTLIIQFNNKENLLILNDIYTDKELNLFTHVHTSKLLEMGKEEAAKALGNIIFARFEGTRNLFPN